MKEILKSLQTFQQSVKPLKKNEDNPFFKSKYASLDSIWADIPVQARPGLAHMRLEDWLGSYRELPGIARALERISRRMKRPFDSSAAMAVFEQQHEAFDQDFHVFFPELKHHLGLLREVQPPSSAMS